MNTRIRGFLAVVLAVAALRLSAHAQTIITQQPLGQTNVAIGQFVSFSVDAVSSATANLQYQWKINGVNIPGATNSVVTITNAQPTNGGEFSVVVTDGQSAVESPFIPLTFNVPFLAGKAFANRLALPSVATGLIASENVAATGDLNDPIVVPDAPGGKGGKRIWFKWTPTADGIVSFTTLGSGFETLLGAYTGTEVTNLTMVPSAVNDDDGAGNLTSRIMFNAIANTEYEIAVDGYWGAYGSVLLSWDEEVTENFLPTFISMPPARTVVPAGTATSFVAHWDTGECDWFYNGQPTSVEVNTFVVAQAGLTNIGKYFIEVSADDDLDTTISRPARLQLNVLDDGTTAPNSFAWPKFLDAVSSAFLPQSVKPGIQPQDGDTRGFSVSQVFSTVGDSSEPGEPSVCGQIPAHPCWYVYVAPTNGSMLISTAGSAFNTVLGVFVGPGNNFSTLTNIGCGYTTNRIIDGQPQVYLPSVRANQTNFIVVDGYAGAKGTVQLTINLGTPVAINSPPQNQVPVPGGNTVLSVDASGSTPVSFAWQMNGTNLPGATNSTLTISNVLSSQTGTYTVIVSNPLSTTNASATLSLAPPPVITNQPLSQTVSVGSGAMFTCQASGTGLGFQWLFDGGALGAATNASLVLTNVPVSAAGSYECVVTNVIGAVTSSVAVLQVDTPPVILVQPASQLANVGATATLSCQGAGGNLQFQWLFDGAQLSGATNPLVVIANAQLSNSGTYACIVDNDAGLKISSVAVLTVGDLPVISVQPLSHTIPVGSTADVSVVASGAPAPGYLWLFNNAPSGSNSSALTIPNFQSSNQGSYQVIVTNSIGAITSAFAVLYLDSPLRLALPSSSNGSFQFQLIGAAGATYLIQSSTNLEDWTALLTNSTATGYLKFTDTNASGKPSQFYRATTN